MESVNNVIANGNFLKGNNNVNVINDNGEIKRNRVDSLATHCSEKMFAVFTFDGRRRKAFYNLSENCVWQCVELAKNKGRSPTKYLSWLLTRELNKSRL